MQRHPILLWLTLTSLKKYKFKELFIIIYFIECIFYLAFGFCINNLLQLLHEICWYWHL